MVSKARNIAPLAGQGANSRALAGNYEQGEELGGPQRDQAKDMIADQKGSDKTSGHSNAAALGGLQTADGQSRPESALPKDQ